MPVRPLILMYPAPTSIGGSVVECSPATRAARVRFPADADNNFLVMKTSNFFTAIQIN